MTSDASPTGKPAEYAFPLRALQRWRAERLSITEAGAGVREVLFKFDGSTCGNIPFELQFRFSIDPTGRMHQLRCAPVQGDEGHSRMCAYLDNADRLLGELAEFPDWEGRSLADTVSWRPTTSPAGCMCAESSRAHKWLAVFHTCHFAIASTPA